MQMPRFRRDIIIAALTWAAALLVAWFLPPAHAQYASVVRSDLPATYYRLDESSTPSANEEPLSAYTDTLTWATVTGNLPGAMSSFDSNTSVELTDAGSTLSNTDNDYSAKVIDLQESWTLEMWLRLTGSGEADEVFRKGAGGGVGALVLEYDNITDDLQFYSSTNAGGCTTTKAGSSFKFNMDSNDGWVHVVITYDDQADDLTGYQDGVVVFQNLSCDIDIPSSNEDIFMETRDFKLDEVAFYRWALPAGSVLSHYAARGACFSGLSFGSRCNPQVGQGLTIDENNRGYFLGPKLSTLHWPAAGWVPDGTNCTATQSVQVGSGSTDSVTICDAVGAGTVQGTLRLPNSYAGGPFRFRHLAANNNATPSATLSVDYHCRCHALGEAESAITSTVPAEGSVTFTTQGATEEANTPPLACDGTCVAGGVMSWRASLDATGQESDILHRGVSVEYRVDTRGAGQ